MRFIKVNCKQINYVIIFPDLFQPLMKIGKKPGILILTNTRKLYLNLQLRLTTIAQQYL